MGLLLSLLCCSTCAAQEVAEFYTLREESERLSAAEHYSQTLAVLAQIDALNLSKLNRRWLEFRTADARWRAAWKTDPAAAKEAILRLLELTARQKEHDTVWAQIKESLGDYQWTRDAQTASWTAAQLPYSQALRWLARQHPSEDVGAWMTRIIWKMAQPPWRSREYVYGDYANWVPEEFLRTALEFGRPPAERAALEYFLAKTLATNPGEETTEEEVRGHFEEAIQVRNAWLDDALFDYAQWLERTARMSSDPAAQRRRAAELYRRVVNEFSPRETMLHERADELVRLLNQPLLEVHAEDARPGEAVVLRVRWANLTAPALKIFSVDLTKDLQPHARPALEGNWHTGNRRWFSALRLDRLHPVYQWPQAAVASSGEEEVALTLPAGAYAIDNPHGARELFLVSRLVLAMSVEKTAVRIFAADAATGQALRDVPVRLFVKTSRGLEGEVEMSNGTTTGTGVAQFGLAFQTPSDYQLLFEGKRSDALQLLAVARSGDDQAFVGDPFSYLTMPVAYSWHLAVFHDRSEYCPGETLFWAVLATRPDYIYRTTDGVEVELSHPLGSVYKSAALPLGEFGRASGTIALGENWRQGQYQLAFTFRDRRGGTPQPMGSTPITIRCEK